jgi:TonB-linked SusC/RagA family outer membrane protein
MKNKLTNAIFPTGKKLLKYMMRLSIFLFCATVFSFTPDNVLSQNTKVVIEADEEVTVDQVFEMISQQTKYAFIYETGLFKDAPKVKLKKGVVSANTLLRLSLASGDYNLVLTKENNILINRAGKIQQQQQQQVSGKVTDVAGQPLPGVTVLIKGTNKGTVTDFDGTYSITVPNPENVLVFSYLGSITQEITVGNQSVIDVVLKEAVSTLEEVTINAGYYKTSQRQATGSIAKIDAKVIDKQPVSNPLAAMQGYIAGVNITQETGLPGSGFKIEIRGKNFIGAGSDPLYIVDGSPYDNELLIEGFQSSSGVPSYNISPLNLIDPASIESIEVLKDADATAIYGSRGANGVVLITTKKGQAGKVKLAVDVSTTMGNVPHVDLLSTEQYLSMQLEALANDGYTLETFPNVYKSYFPSIFAWDQDRYTDWQEVLIGDTAVTNKAKLSFSGGNEQTQFSFGGGYEDQSTVFPENSKYKKGFINGNISHQSIDNRLQLQFSVNYSTDDNQLPGFSGVGFTRLAYTLAPNAPTLYDEEGELNWENDTWANPFAQLVTKARLRSNNVRMNSLIAYRPIPELELKVNLGYSNSASDSYRATPHNWRNPAWGFSSIRHSYVQIYKSSSNSWNIEPQINWKKDWGNTKVNVLIGTTFQRKGSNQINAWGSGFATNKQILNLTAATNSGISLDEERLYNYQSFFGRINLKWVDKYLLNLTARRDGSSRFGPGKQFGNFGAIGTAWIFSEEAFLKNNSVLSFGKLRSSYGITGSDSTLDYAFYDSYTTTSSNYNGSVLESTRLFNPIFAWEENKKFEVALELGFLQDRISITTAWYKNRSSNQLVGIPLAATTGFSSVNANFDATVENTGLEIDFRTVNIQNKEVEWSTIFNFSMPKNKLVKYDGLENSTYKNTLVIGQPLSVKKLYNNTGVDPATGYYQFKDYNNDGVINGLDNDDLFKDLAPKFYGGIGNIVNYKKFTLDVFFQFKKHILPLPSTGGNPGGPANQLTAVAGDHWQQVGDEKAIQRYTLGLDSQASTANSRYMSSNAYFTDASFIRLRNVSLNYKLPSNIIPGMNANIYLQGQNILTFTKYKGADPDQAQPGYLPFLKQFTLGVKLGF